MPKSRKPLWFEDESFWRDTYPFMFSDSRIEAAKEETEQVLGLAKPKGKDLLDLCCGPGRFAIELAKRKFRVTAVDRTKFLLDKAKARARRNKQKIEWVGCDMREFVRPDAFDLVINLYTSFGYFEDPNEDLQILRNIHTSLRAGGICVFDLIGKERLAKIFLPSATTELPNGSKLIQLHQIIDDWTRIQNEWIVIKNERATSYHFPLRVYSGLEFRDRLEQAGFSKIKLYGSFAGAPYDEKAQRLVVVARK